MKIKCQTVGFFEGTFPLFFSITIPMGPANEYSYPRPVHLCQKQVSLIARGYIGYVRPGLVGYKTIHTSARIIKPNNTSSQHSQMSRCVLASLRPKLTFQRTCWLAFTTRALFCNVFPLFCRLRSWRTFSHLSKSPSICRGAPKVFLNKACTCLKRSSLPAPHEPLPSIALFLCLSLSAL